MISRSSERREPTARRTSATKKRDMMRYTKTQHRPASRHVNDHGRVSGTHRAQWRIAGMLFWGSIVRRSCAPLLRALADRRPVSRIVGLPRTLQPAHQRCSSGTRGLYQWVDRQQSAMAGANRSIRCPEPVKNAQCSRSSLNARRTSFSPSTPQLRPSAPTPPASQHSNGATTTTATSPNATNNTSLRSRVDKHRSIIGPVRLAIIEDRLNTMPRKLHDWHSAHSVYTALCRNDR